jgi:hypothetical protein
VPKHTILPMREVKKRTTNLLCAENPRGGQNDMFVAGLDVGRNTGWRPHSQSMVTVRHSFVAWQWPLRMPRGRRWETACSSCRRSQEKGTSEPLPTDFWGCSTQQVGAPFETLVASINNVMVGCRLFRTKFLIKER